MREVIVTRVKIKGAETREKVPEEASHATATLGPDESFGQFFWRSSSRPCCTAWQSLQVCLPSKVRIHASLREVSCENRTSMASQAVVCSIVNCGPNVTTSAATINTLATKEAGRTAPDQPVRRSFLPAVPIPWKNTCIPRPFDSGRAPAPER